MADNDNHLNQIVQTLKNFVSTIVDVDSALSGVNRQAGQFDEKYSDFIINACQNSEELTGSILEMGDAVKVLSMRMRGMKDELQALGEEYENQTAILGTIAGDQRSGQGEALIRSFQGGSVIRAA